MFRTAFLSLALILGFSSVGYSQAHGHAHGAHGTHHNRGFGLGAVGGFGIVGAAPFGYGYGDYGYGGVGYGGFGYPGYGYNGSFYPGYGYYPNYGYYPQTYNGLGSLTNSIQGATSFFGGW